METYGIKPYHIDSDSKGNVLGQEAESPAMDIR